MFPPMLTTKNPEEWGGLKGKLFVLLQFCYLLVVNFMSHQGLLRASALTFTTILSLIPFLAIAFAVLKGFGVQNALDPLLRQVAGDSQTTITNVINYVNNTNFKSVGAIGLLMLVFTVISLLGNIEEAFNAIWRVKETRPLKRRFSDYLSVVIVGPLLLLVATSLTSGLQSQWLVKWLIERTYFGDAIISFFRLIPYISIWIALTFIYSYIPNTRVRLRSALLGGVLAGTVWQLAQWGYFHFQIGVANYNAIYGTLAALPVFLVWIYTSWLIVLFGLEIVCAHQHHRYGIAGLFPDSLGSEAREQLSLALMVQICSDFITADPPPTTEQLENELEVPPDLLEEILTTLSESGFLVATSGEEPGWLPAREPSEVLVCDVLAALRGKSSFDGASSPAALLISAEVISQSMQGSQESLKRMSLHDLAIKVRQR